MDSSNPDTGAGSILASAGRALRDARERYDYLCELNPPEGVCAASLLDELNTIRSRQGLGPQHAGHLAWAAVLFSIEHEAVRGLVDPFMGALGYREAERKNTWQKPVGPMIRSALAEWCGEEYEVGTWRFVGSVRLHAGIPRMLEDRFAGLLFDLAVAAGIDGIGQLEDQALANAVKKHFGNLVFASEFLGTEAGRSLIFAVAADLERAGWPGETDEAMLSSATGYRAGFLTRLYEKLEQLRLAGEHGKPPIGLGSAWRPTFFMDAASCRLGLRFPGLEGSKQIQYQVKGLDGKVRGPRFFEDGWMPSGGRAEGTATRGEKVHSWSVAVWPRLDSHWAVFTPQGQYLGCDPDLAALPSGTYFAVTRTSGDDRVILAPSVRYSSLGMLEAGSDFGFFDVLQVEHGPEPALPRLAVGKGRETPRLTVETPRQVFLDRWAAEDVFVGGSLALRVSPWDAEDARRYRLLLDGDGVYLDLTEQLQLKDGAAVVELAEPPRRGRVRLEARGRQARQAPGDVYYVLWPADTRVTLEHRVYGTDESAAITVEPGPGDSAEPAGQISVPAGRDTCELRLRDAAGVELDLRVRVPRVRLYCPSKRRGETFIDRPKWTAQAKAIDGDADLFDGLRLEALADEDWELVVEGADKAGREVSLLDGQIASSGGAAGVIAQKHLPFAAISDALGKAPQIGRYRLKQAGRCMGLGAYHLDSESLKHAVKEPAPPQWLPEALRLGVAELAQLQRGGDPDTSSTDRKDPAVLAEALAGWRMLERLVRGEPDGLCGRAREVARLLGRADGAGSSPEAAAALRDELAGYVAEDALAHCMADVGLPGVETPTFARDRLTRTLERLKDLAEAERRVARALQGLMTMTKGGAEAPGVLADVVRAYARGFSDDHAKGRAQGYVAKIVGHKDAIEQLEEPWREVGATLYGMTLLRVGEISAFLALDSDRHSAFVGWLADHLRDPGCSNVVVSPTWDLPQASPLPDDAELVAMAKSGAPTDPSHRPSWLCLWLRWRLMHASKHPTDPQELDRLRSGLLDPSAAKVPFQVVKDGRRLREELKSGIPGSWP